MILRYLAAAVLLYLLYRIARRFFLPADKKVKPLTRNEQNSTRAEDLVEDPCCHTYVPIGEACKADMDGKTYFFCSRHCMEEYKNKIKHKPEDA